MADDSKTEKPTPKRRNDERKKGNIFMSRDAIAVVTLVGSFFVLKMLLPTFSEQLGQFMTFCIQSSVTWTGENIQDVVNELVRRGLMVVVKTAGPILLATIACAVIATVAQTKFLVTTELIKPKPDKLNPIQGFKRLFSLKSLIEAMKGLVKVIILMVLVYMNLRNMLLESSRYLYVDLSAAVAHLIECASTMVIQIVIAFIAVATVDFFYQRWDYERNLKMSKEEIKEEYKQMEGDPKVKGKIKQIQRQRAMQRMMQQVPKADVVVRNPTHFAVALRYKPDQDAAPIVLAKGQDSIALRIVQIAEEHHVAVMENVPLARALYAEAELNQEIPPALYAAVAEVLVYIFRLNDKKQLTKQ